MLTRGLLAPVLIKRWHWMGRMRSLEIQSWTFPFEFLQPKNGFTKKEVEKHCRKINSIRKPKNTIVFWVGLLRFIHEFLEMKPKLFATKTNKTQTILNRNQSLRELSKETLKKARENPVAARIRTLMQLASELSPQASVLTLDLYLIGLL